jgi:hypothetical protein
MTLHPGMKFEYTKGQAKGRRGRIVEVDGNQIKVKTRRSGCFWVDKNTLENKVKWVK